MKLEFLNWTGTWSIFGRRSEQPARLLASRAGPASADRGRGCGKASPTVLEVLMIQTLFPRSYDRYLCLPIVGPVIEEFSNWLTEQGYRRGTRKLQIKAVAHIDAYLRQRRVRCMSECRVNDLDSCWACYRQCNTNVSSTVHVLQRFLEASGLIAVDRNRSCGPTGAQISAYADYLKSLRGFAHSTVRNHLFTAEWFLDHLNYETIPDLSTVSHSDIETFVRCAGEKLSRGSLQHTVAHLRGFLRFLASKGAVSPGLDRQIDTPRLYRQEKLPRSLSWNIVGAFLDSIDRTTPLGLRDHTMFSLMAAYGLRSCDIASLTLDDIHWRRRRIRIMSQKNGNPFALPLTDDAATLLIDYLRHGRPLSSRRELFLRMRAPEAALKPTAVSEAFRKRVKKSGLDIAVQGPHCLRHSYAVRLLREGIPLKAIGDLLGHRSTESTCVYLRLATEDLRDAALPIPPLKTANATEAQHEND